MTYIGVSVHDGGRTDARVHGHGRVGREGRGRRGRRGGLWRRERREGRVRWLRLHFCFFGLWDRESVPKVLFILLIIIHIYYGCYLIIKSSGELQASNNNLHTDTSAKKRHDDVMTDHYLNAKTIHLTSEIV